MNYFLYAEVGTERDGMSLTVLSALARLGLDPWQEAEHLARLSRVAAIDGLARLIAAMPASRWPIAEAVAIAARLVVLLPQPRTAAVARPEAIRSWLTVLLPQPARSAPPTARQWAIVAVVLLGAIVAVVMTLPGHRSQVSTDIVLGDSSAGRPAFLFTASGDPHAHDSAAHSALPHFG